jgi:hypothetical protein
MMMDESRMNVTAHERAAQSMKQKPLPNVVIEEEQR